MQKSDKPSQSCEAPASRGRGRPRAFDREAALAQATHLFWSKGYEATSIADLTEAMGISSPSLYAAFGSKEALYAEALDHYGRCYDAFVWSGFSAAKTVREAVEMLLKDSAAALTGGSDDLPRGCMVALSSVGSEGHVQLGELVKSARAIGFNRIKRRLERGAEDGEISSSADLHALARFIQTVQSGMSILARDGASRSELEAVAETAMDCWDLRTKRA